MLQLIIDNRETDLLDIECSAKVLENIELGDIVFKDTDNNSFVLVIERKKISDLGASIKDGRYREQKYRIMNALPKTTRKMYLIEGKYSKKFGLSQQTYKGSIINTLIRDNLLVYFTKDVDETREFILDIYNRLNKYYKDISTNTDISIDEISYTSVCKINKKKNITKKCCQINQLSQIPGVSTKTATSIINHFDDMNTLYLSQPDIETIANIRGNTNRKIGVKLATKIHEFLF
jgi:crossover junction endonuclease MUS81